MQATQQDPQTVTDPPRPTPASEKARRSVLPRVILVLGAVVIAWVWFTRDQAASESLPPLPRIAKVPGFSLTRQDGRTITPDDLAGSVWVADFIFTRCAGPCPQLSLRMRSLQKGIAEFGGAVKLVSFSVDPTYDQPPVLRAYAKRYGAEPDLWWFLTCDDKPMMYELVKSGFLQALSEAKGSAPIIHSTRFVLVDQKGDIRAWYDGLDPASKALIIRDAKRLLAESLG